MNTQNDKQAALRIAVALAETIRGLGQVPSGHLYAQVMGHMSLATFDAVVGALKGAGVVKEQNHLLTWVA